MMSSSCRMIATITSLLLLSCPMTKTVVDGFSNSLITSSATIVKNNNNNGNMRCHLSTSCMLKMTSETTNDNGSSNDTIGNKDVPRLNSDELKDLPSIVEFPTATQKKVLRKEASKRQAQNKLAKVTLPESEMYGLISSSSNDNSQTLQKIVKRLKNQELCEIRGISRDDKKDVFAIANRIAMDLEYEIQNDVTVISSKGHSAILYTPMNDDGDDGNDNSNDDDEDDSDNDDNVPKLKKILLRTSVGQKNTWVRRVKAPRDNRGQIIKD